MIKKGLWPLFFIPGTAGFDTLRYSGFSTLRYSGFDTLRTQASIRYATQPA